MLPNPPHSPPRHANTPAMHQSTPFERNASGYKAQKAEVVGFQVHRKAMCQEMTGFWVGPCEVDKFFELTMPLSLYKFLAPHSLSSESLDIMQKPSQGAPLLEHLEIDSEIDDSQDIGVLPS
ncbi:hypothetical protein PTI98_004053 [Pleurotus ostreatus]|nr:hypothetical protein PTI98_004053 [Pleurotus ostreatus]